MMIGKKCGCPSALVCVSLKKTKHGNPGHQNSQFVIVSYGGEVGIGNTLFEALGDTLGVDPSTTPIDPPPTTGGNNNGGDNNGGENPPDPGTVEEQIASLLGRAQAAFEAADAAFRRGDTITWAEQNEQARTFIERAIALSEGGAAPAEE